MKNDIDRTLEKISYFNALGICAGGFIGSMYDSKWIGMGISQVIGSMIATGYIVYSVNKPGNNQEKPSRLNSERGVDSINEDSVVPMNTLIKYGDTFRPSKYDIIIE